MESVDSILFIGTVIIALTEMIKRLAPGVQGIITMLVSAGVGLLVALVDTHIGIGDISIAQGILFGLSASGSVSLAKSFATQAPPKDSETRLVTR